VAGVRRPSADASFAEQQLRQISARGAGAGGDFVVGMMVLAGALLEDLAACTARDCSALLQDLALRYV
jgi:hypothetical protein